MIITRIVRQARALPKEIRTSYKTEYNWYPNTFSWTIRLYDRFLRRVPRAPLPARKAVVTMRFRDMKYPFYVRLGSSDLQLHQTIRFRGEYKPVLEKNLPNSFRQVVDLGSNAGYTIRLWRELFPEARIIGVEPDAGNMRVCRLNANAIPGSRVDLVEACVDGKKGFVWLDRSESEHRFHIGDGPNGNSVQVEALTVPDILERTKADPIIDLLKCDIQGAERAVFADCKSWIFRVRNMIVEVHPPYGADNLISDLKRNGWAWSEHAQHKTDNLWVLFFWNN